MLNETGGSRHAKHRATKSGRRTFLRDGLSLVGGTALASVALDVLRDPDPALGAPPQPRPVQDRPTCLAVAPPAPPTDPPDLTADPERILTCDDARMVILWRPKKNNPGFHRRPFLKLHGDKATYVTVSHDKVLTASYDGMVLVRDLTDETDNNNNPAVFNRHPEFAPPNRKSEVWVAALSTDGTKALSGDNFGNILYWDTGIAPPPPNGPIPLAPFIHHFKHEDEWVAALAFMPGPAGMEQKRFISGHENGKMVLWDFSVDPAAPQKTEFKNPNDKYPVNTVAVISNGAFIVSAGFDGTVRIWDPANSAAPKRQIALGDVVVWRVAISPDNKTLAAATQNFGNEGRVRLFNIQNLNVPPPALAGPPAENGGVMGVGFLDNTRVVYTTGNAGNVHIKVFP